MSDIRKALDMAQTLVSQRAAYDRGERNLMFDWSAFSLAIDAARAALAQPTEPAAPLAMVKVFGCYDAAQIPLDVRGVYQIDAFTTGVYVQMPSGAAAPIAPAEPAARYRWLRTADKVGISAEAARDPVVYDAAIDAARSKT